MNIPHWCSSSLSVAGLEQVEKAIEEAEKKTTGEIVPVLVRRSSAIGHIPLLLFALIFMFLHFIGWTYLVDYFFEWHWWYLLFEAVGALLLVYASVSFKWVQRQLIPSADRILQVQNRAQLEFYQMGLHTTKKSTGILLFVSLMERQAVVLGDKAIADRLPPEVWQEVIALLVEGVHKKDLALGLVQAIAKCGQILSEHFPITACDTNELKNHLVIKN